MKKKLAMQWMSATGILVALVLFLAVNMLASKFIHGARLDLTESNLYTLSEGTQNILKSLDEPVTLRYFLSRKLATKLPSVNNYANRVGSLLEEYQRIAGENLRLIKIDVESFSDNEDKAVGYGLSGIPVSEQDSLYFGLVGTGATDEEEVIPYFSNNRDSFLEYDITKMIQQLGAAKKSVIGIISGLPMQGQFNPQMMAQGGQPRSWVILEQIQEQFDVRQLGNDVEKIDEQIDVLLIVHPKDLPDTLLYAIDQYVLAGGRVMAFLDPNAEEDVAPNQGAMGGGIPNVENVSTLGKLLKSWGLDYRVDKLVASLPAAVTVQTQRNGRVVQVRYPLWMNLNKDSFDQEDPIIAEVENLVFGSPGFLKPAKDAATQFTPLVKLDGESAIIEKESILGPPDPFRLAENYKPSGEEQVLVARVSGKVKTAYPDGKPAGSKEDSDSDISAEENPAKKSENETAPHLTESTSDAQIIVVSDTDFLVDRFWVEAQEILGSRLFIPTAGNGAFVINALDNLTGSNDMISVRSRTNSSRPFEKINDLLYAAQTQYRQEEAALEAELDQAEQQLIGLERQQGKDKRVISKEVLRTLKEARSQQVRTRKALRDLRRNLRKDIEGLETMLKFINIALVPLLIALFGTLFFFYKTRNQNKTY